jgi:hypothetical protein
MTELERRVAELEKLVKALAASSTIPFNVEQAFKERLKLKSFGLVSIATSFDTGQYLRAVDEGGMSSYNVVAPPDDILLIRFDGHTYGIPAYNP